MVSPFSSSPATCCPLARVSNFNIFLSGVAVFQQPLNYGYEFFLNEVRRSKSVYGGQVRGLSSGLISQNDWEFAYPFIYVDVMSRVPNMAVDNAAKAVQI